MKTIFTIILFVFVSFSTGFSADVEHHNYSILNDHFDISKDGNSIIITCDDDDTEVEFTENNNLIVNGKKYDLNRKQRKMVKHFKEEAGDFIYTAEKLGIEAAKIGVEGVEIGVRAIAEALDNLFDGDLDDDEFLDEKHIKEIEKAAKKLEKKAEKLEESLENLEELHADLVKEIEPLQNIAWY